MARKAAAPVTPTAAKPEVSPPSPLSAFARSLSSHLSSVTLYAAPCFSGGALAAAFHEVLKLDITTAFTLGFFSLVGPVYLTYASGWGMRRTLSGNGSRRD
jgi:hypothetical protein